MLAPLLAYLGVLALGYGLWHISASIAIINATKFYMGLGLVIIGIPLVAYICTVLIYLRFTIEDKQRRHYL